MPQVRQRVDFGDWVKKHVGKLTDSVSKVKNVQPAVTYGPKGEWTIAKLLVLGYWVEVYTRIISNQMKRGFFESMFYIDLLAGSGICSIQREAKSAPDIVAGSAVVAATYCSQPFTRYILFESDKRRSNALEERMCVLADNVDVLAEDCNQSIDHVSSKLTPRSHFLAFVDNEGADVKWQTLKKLLNKNGDLWVTFQTSEIRRVAQTQAAREFLGLENDEQMPADMLAYYTKKIENCGRIVKVIHVPGKGGFSYDLMFVTRPTKAGNPWLSIIDRLKERVEKLDIDFVRNILDQLSGKQPDLRGFLKASG